MTALEPKPAQTAIFTLLHLQSEVHQSVYGHILAEARLDWKKTENGSVHLSTSQASPRQSKVDGRFAGSMSWVG